MSERLIDAYRKRERKRLKSAIQFKNRKHINRMLLAGAKFKLRNPEGGK